MGVTTARWLRDVLPSEVYAAQVYWDKVQMVRRMRALGFAQNEINALADGTIPRQYVDLALSPISPIERYLAEPPLPRAQSPGSPEMRDYLSRRLYEQAQMALEDPVARAELIERAAPMLRAIADRRANWHKGKRRKP